MLLIDAMKLPSLSVLLVLALAACGEPHPDPEPEPEPPGEVFANEPRSGFGFSTPNVSMSARHFAIQAGGETFFARVPGVDVHGDYGDAERTTLELTWIEHDVEMRLYIYFKSDGVKWWSEELRTYDGNPQGDWITYTGRFFEAPLGQAFLGDLALETPAGTTPAGALHIENLRLQAFIPAECDDAPYTLVHPYDDIETPPSGTDGGFRTHVFVYDADCKQVLDLTRFAFEWRIDDPAIAQLSGEREVAELRGLVVGETTAHVRMLDDAGATLAELAIPVRIHEWP